MIYRLRYCNKDGVEARVDIQKGSATPVIDVEGTERPFILSYNNDKGNKSGMFLSSSADIEIYETTDFNIDNLKTSNETELSVTHYINNVISWQGFIIPDFFSIEVRSNPVITMTASDRLGTLKNVTLSDLPSIISLRELAILCLNKTGLELPLRTMADFNNGTGINDFFNSKILTQRLSDTKGRSISCYDILSSILTASYSFLVQRTGTWHIINKIQHEAGSGKLYTGATSFINWSDVIFNFSDISIGGRRTIIPVASTVGVFHEFGGGKLHPDNYDFAQGTAGWVASGGYSMAIEDREIKGYSKSGSNWVADFGQTTTKKRLKVQNLLNFPLTNLDTAPYAKATFPLITTNTSSVDISMDMSVVGMPWYRTGVVVLAEKGTTLLAFSQSSGKFEPYDPQLATNPGYPDFMINLSLPVQGSAEDKSYYDASTKSMKFSGKLEDSDLTGWNITIRLYGYYSLQLGSRVDFPMFFSFANVSFSNTNEIPKGNIYKTEKDGDFTKAHDIDTSIFADYITYGLNGFFYEYPIDDTSSLYNSANELTSKWTAYNDTEQLPLLQHITRQRSRLFSVAHDLLSAEIEVNDFDPLAIFVACGKRHTVVSAQFDFFKSNLSVELEEIDFQSASARDFIYSYFGDGEEGIKSIGGVSGGTGGGGTGGGLTPEQIEILSFWKKDPDNPDTIFTEMNAYSTKELSAYGVGDGGGGGGGSDYERLDTWADYDSSRAGWVLSAFLGNDLNTRVTAIDGRVTDLENSTGGGSVTSVGISVPTGLSVSNSPITSSGVIAIGLQAGYSIPTTVKQGQWDTAYNNNHIHSNKTVLDDITSALISNWNTAFDNNHTHSNKTQLDLITQSNIDVLAKLSIVNGNLQIDGNAYATGELSAYGAGDGGGGGGGGGIIETVYGYGNLGQTFNNANLTDTFNAYTINQINTRLVSVENGSATTVNTTGTGNAITSISKSGTVITANKDLTFSLSNHLHTGVYEPVFTKNTAFNKNFGTASGTVAEGNHTHDYLPLSGGTLTGNINITPLEGTLGVRTHRVGASGYMWPYGSSLSNIRTGLGFGWRDTEWIIGNIRGDSIDSYGFGIGYRNANGDLDGEFRVAPGGVAYLNNVQIATRSTTLAGYGITDAVTLNTAQTITGLKTFDSNIILGVYRNIQGTDGYTGVWNVDNKLWVFGSSSTGSVSNIRSEKVGVGTDSPTQKLHVIGNILATGTTTTTKVIFNSAGWSMEQTGTELLLKYNNLIAARFLSDGSIVGLGEITAYGATTGGEGVSLLRTGGTMTGPIRWSTQSSNTPFIGRPTNDASSLMIALNSTTWQGGLTLGGSSGNLLWKGSQVLDKANTANKIEMGNGWTIEQTVDSLTIRKDGAVKGTFNA